MDVRFYPPSSGSSLPGDPSNLDFAQCLGYYNYNKVIMTCFFFSISLYPPLTHPLCTLVNTRPYLPKM
uniref:Uncharacterized protein n=1 Tax=Anolis carolinensis TaxID=28377 RepID=A0A803TWE3_ANOCA